MADVRPLAESDLAEARRIFQVAFGTFLGVPDPANFFADRDLVYGRFGAEHTAAFAADADGALAGTNFATRWGSVGFFGPLTMRPELWNRGLAQPLVGAACAVFEQWGLSHTGLYTFAESAKHIHLYGKFGFHPRFLTAIMAMPARPGVGTGAFTRYSVLSDGDRETAESACRELTEALYPGLDLGAEIRTATARGLGDTVLLGDNGGSKLASFAICHYGPASEAGAGCLYVKFGAVRRGRGAGARFADLLDACEALALAVGMPNVLAGVNLAREEAYRQMTARGFRTEIQGVTLHRDNQPGYSRPGLYVLDDWR